MPSSAQVLIFDSTPSPAGELHDFLRARGLEPAWRDPAEGLGNGNGSSRSDLAVVLVHPDEPRERQAAVSAVLRRLVEEHVATLVCGGDEQLRREGGPLIEYLPADTPPGEIAGKLGTLARYIPLVKGLERELNHLHRLGEQLNRYFGEIDQEMRLAGRLQRDFLPRALPDVPGWTFSVFYRPASWVSGDLYDVFRLDDHHIGVLLADAMGHGVAAGLLTMFLRQALVTRGIAGDQTVVLTPAAALEHLHQALLRQQLPNSQFVTAAYALLDLRSGELRIARAGHPYPLHLLANGEITEVRTNGSLLGLADVPIEFEETTVQIKQGDKLVLYTDGVEDVLLAPAADDPDAAAFTPHFTAWSRLGAAELLQRLGDYLDHREGSLHPADDITVLAVEATQG